MNEFVIQKKKLFAGIASSNTPLFPYRSLVVFDVIADGITQFFVIRVKFLAKIVKQPIGCVEVESAIYFDRRAGDIILVRGRIIFGEKSKDRAIIRCQITYQPQKSRGSYRVHRIDIYDDLIENFWACEP